MAVIKEAQLKKADAWLSEQVDRLQFGPRPIDPTPLDAEAGARIESAGGGWRLVGGGQTIAMPEAATFDDTWAVWSDNKLALVACSESIVLRIVLATKAITRIETGHVRATAIAPVGRERFLLVTPGLGRNPTPRLELRSYSSKQPLHDSASPTPLALAPIAGGPLAWVLGRLNKEKHPHVKAVPASRLSIVDTTTMLQPWITFWLPGLEYRLGRREGRTVLSGHGRTFELGDEATITRAFQESK